jgi:hypothetical protein
MTKPRCTKGYDFNGNAPIGRVIVRAGQPPPSTAPRATCQVTIPVLTPAVAIAAPQGATHVRYIACSSEVDFENGSIKAANANSGYTTLNNAPQAAILLAVNVDVNAAKPIFIGVGLEFYQEVNGQKYLLQNGQFNPFQIVLVDTGIL